MIYFVLLKIHELRNHASWFYVNFVFQSPNNQVRFAAVGDQQALTYFDIDSVSGVVRLRQPLYTGNLNQYLVRDALRILQLKNF